MDNTIVRNSEGMLCGAYIGKLKYLLDNKDGLSAIDTYKSASHVDILLSIVDSINEKKHICLNDIINRTNDVSFDGSVQYLISPIAFIDLFDILTTCNTTLSDLITNVVSIFTKNRETQLLCIEYVRLLHDILWFNIDKNGILEILPELDVLESEVRCSKNEKDIFFAALWSFIFSDDYSSCYEKAANLENTNSDIVGVACTIAGLYYGTDSIPTDWAEYVFESIGDIDKSKLSIIFS